MLKKIIAILITAYSVNAWAQTINIMVGFPAGGITDVYARVIERHLTNQLRQSIVVVNRPGAEGRLAMDHVAAGSKDLLLANTGPFLFSQILNSKVNNTFENFHSLVPMARTPVALVVNSNSTVRDLNDLVKLSRQRPITCAGSSASAVFIGKYLMDQLKIADVTWVPFRGSSDMSVQLMAGNIDCSLDALSQYLPLHAAGKLKIISVSAATRSVNLAEVSLFRDAVPGLVFYNWYGIAVPKSFDPAERDRIFLALRQIAHQPDYRSGVEKINLEPIDPPADSTAWLRAEYQKWETVRQRAGIPKID